jgi:hypothetical protein
MIYQVIYDLRNLVLIRGSGERDGNLHPTRGPSSGSASRGSVIKVNDVNLFPG